ncbi:MAG: hypothetical protein KME10_12015 [Plectolyngbya sp. WJT66-NPBG17]|jgi:energy-coupling factor transporter transmembrane protein EcfT|nr:hypothetical protein [Plectolyngbya sp. WJT66-NPBG17]
MAWKILLEPDLFSFTSPFLRRKRSAFEVEDLPGLWRVHWQLGDKTVLSTFYTRIDQACLLWGIISTLIFSIAQFCLLDWRFQAVLWTGLTLVGTIAMLRLSRPWRTIKPLSDVIDGWVFLMLFGVALTDFSIFLGWGQMLLYLCPLWLAIDGIGYVYTGVKMRSRAFAFIGLLNFAGIAILPYFDAWQFLTTGLITGISTLLMAELQWDSGDVCAHLAELQSRESEI